MATQTIEFPYVSGVTIASVKLFLEGSDTQVVTSPTTTTATEETNRKGTYLAAFTDVAAGTYRFIAFVGSVAVYTDMIDLTLTTATFRGYLEQTADTSLLVTIDTKIDAIPTTAMRGTDSAATEAKQDIIDTNVDTIISTGSTGPWTAGAGSDATMAKQNEIIALLAAGATIQSPVPTPKTIELIHLDEYDGTASPKLPWAVAKSYLGADNVKLAIWSKGDPSVILKTAAAVVESATLITVSMTASFTPTLSFEGCPLTSEHEFALVAEWPSSNPETIAWGKAFIYQRAVPV